MVLEKTATVKAAYCGVSCLNQLSTRSSPQCSSNLHHASPLRLVCLVACILLLIDN